MKYSKAILTLGLKRTQPTLY